MMAHKLQCVSTSPAATSASSLLPQKLHVPSTLICNGSQAAMHFYLTSCHFCPITPASLAACRSRHAEQHNLGGLEHTQGGTQSGWHTIWVASSALWVDTIWVAHGTLPGRTAAQPPPQLKYISCPSF